MFKRTQQNDNSKSDALDYVTWLLFGVIPAIIFLNYFLRQIYDVLQSRKRRPRTRAPRYPPWLSGNLCGPKLRESIHPFPGFVVYTQDYTMQTWTHKNTIQEKDKHILKKMRKLIGKMYDLTVDWEIYPDSVCIVSLPKQNFRSGVMPGTFIPIHGGPPDDSFFEYEMIGDYRIQAAYYVVGGVSYVAGICIYIENPYQEVFKYNESIMWKLMSQPEYWSTYDLKEESIHIVLRKSYEKFMIITKDKYGEEYKWNWNDDHRKFEIMGPAREHSYEVERDEDPRVQSKFMEVKMCETQQEMVMIMEKNGKKVHANWNKITKEIDLFPCETCNHYDDPPPSYLLVLPDF